MEMIMNKLTKVKLSDVADIIGGGTPDTKKQEFWNGNIPWITPKDLSSYNYRYISNGERNITKKGLENSSARILPQGSILLTSRAPIGYIAIAQNELCTNQGFKSLILKENNCPLFFYYLLKNNIKYIINMSSGSTFPEISGSQVKNLEFNIPDLTTQEKIARVLSSLDDKIELNNKINQNLEQQAQAIYNQLILTQELKEKTLSEIIEITDGTHDSPKVKEEGYYLITSKHLSKYGVNKDNANYISEEDFNKINERSKVDKYDILMSMIGTVGLVSLIIEEDIDFAVKNVGIFKTSLQKNYIYFIFSYLLSSSTQNYVKSHLAGTTQKYISLGELRNLKIKIPNEKILASFNNLVHPIYQKIIYNTNEIKILTQLRDTLLPKLMSGEIDVNKI